MLQCDHIFKVVQKSGSLFISLLSCQYRNMRVGRLIDSSNGHLGHEEDQVVLKSWALRPATWNTEAILKPGGAEGLNDSNRRNIYEYFVARKNR